MNIEGLNRDAISLQQIAAVDPTLKIASNATWSPEGSKIIYNHHKSLIAGVSFQLAFRILDKTKLPDIVRVTLMHQNGIEPTVEVSLVDLKT